MKAGIFDPYLDTLGGGERYAITVGKCLVQRGCEVDIFWNDEILRKKLEKRFKISLRRVNFVEDIFCSKKNLLKKWQITRKYDAIFYISDGSIPFLFAKKNILHFQVPFTDVKGNSLLNRIKFKKIRKVVCNSKFTQKFINREYGIKSEVIYPPVDVASFRPGKKENIILAVGRFTRETATVKGQEVLIDSFKQMEKGLGGWSLILAGGMRNEDKSYIEKLKREAKGSPIEILVNVDFPTLQKLYGKAKIFWHAAGFGEDEEKHPERMEHFGIVVVEAMAAGCVPVVIGKGGIPEIVNDGENGFLWKTKDELRRLTLQLIKLPKLLKKVSVQAIKDSRRFSKEVFCQKINELLEG